MATDTYEVEDSLSKREAAQLFDKAVSLDNPKSQIKLTEKPYILYVKELVFFTVEQIIHIIQIVQVQIAQMIQIMMSMLAVQKKIHHSI